MAALTMTQLMADNKFIHTNNVNRCGTDVKTKTIGHIGNRPADLALTTESLLQNDKQRNTYDVAPDNPVFPDDDNVITITADFL